VKGKKSCIECGRVGCPSHALAQVTGTTTTGYICQFCGRQPPAHKWRKKGHQCPCCGRMYDASLAQDSP
jgi:hypothetical protein